MSPKIKILPENLINIIAAGEVVDRPASIVKELLENSIDAAATKIDISISGSGKKSITIIDNGYGMDYENALIALERHATSKIEKSEDLLSINSFGFRGEALPSIAAVSNFILTTKSKNSTLGTEINVKGGTVSKVDQTGFPIGTKIVVSDLFFNVPARAKFLKSDSTELSHIIQTVIREAIPRPAISFSLSHNNRSILKLPGVTEIIKRIYQIHGEEAMKQLIPIEAKHEDISIQGYISNPALTRTDCQGEYLYINNRYIRNPLIQKIIHQSYRNTIPHGRYPIFILLLELPGQIVDFNVHPAKLEVRLSQTKEIIKILQEAISSALYNPYTISDNKTGSLQNLKNEAIKSNIAESSGDYQKNCSNNTIKGNITGNTYQNLNTNYSSIKNRSDIPPYNYKTSTTDNKPRLNSKPLFDEKPHSDYKASFDNRPLFVDKSSHGKVKTPIFNDKSLKRGIPSSNNTPALFSQNNNQNNNKEISDIFVVCSPFLRLFNSYIIFESKAGLTIIDQHAAHERINYERFKSMLLKKKIARQNLITQPSINISPDEEVFLNEALPYLKEFGFEVEPFGPHTLIVRTVPLYFNADPTPLLIEIFNQIKEMGGEIKKDIIIEQLAAKMACHNSIKAKESIEKEQISLLIKQLSETKEPFFCPHGRPTILNMTIHEIEKKFGRIK